MRYQLFRLPQWLKNPALLKKWLAKLRLENPSLQETNCICSAPFADDCFERDLKAELMPGTKPKHILKTDAVPTVFAYRKKLELRRTSTMRIKAKEDKEVCVCMHACVCLCVCASACTCMCAVCVTEAVQYIDHDSCYILCFYTVNTVTLLLHMMWCWCVRFWDDIDYQLYNTSDSLVI